MALSNYTELSAAVSDWLADDALAASFPEFLALAEAEMNRRLRDVQQEARATLSATGEFVALPADYAGMRSIHLPGGDRDRALEQMSHDEMLTLYAGQPEGTPRAFAIVGAELRLAPVPAASTSIEIVYYRKVPALTSLAPTNWLLTEHPDLYLFATMMMAELRGWNDNRLPIIKARVEEIFAQMETSARRRQWGAAPIAPRAAPAQTRMVRI